MKIGKSNLAPIAIFAFNRPQHLRNLIRSLEENPKWLLSEVIFFIDGPRHDKDRKLISEVEDIVKKLNHKQCQIYVNKQNRGLSTSIIEGLNKVFENYEEVIVLEDDLVVSNQFLDFMNLCLKKFKDELKIGAIQGYSPINLVNQDKIFYMKGADCWGWATWRDKWELFNSDGLYLYSEINRRKLIRAFNVENSYPFFEMLKRQYLGLNNSWAIRWHASLFISDKYSVYPPKTLVMNLGMDGSGTNSTLTNKYQVKIQTNIDIDLDLFPIAENRKIVRKVKKEYRRKFHYYGKYSLGWIYWGIIRRLKHKIGKILISR